jgi:hypothetical protein
MAVVGSLVVLAGHESRLALVALAALLAVTAELALYGRESQGRHRRHWWSRWRQARDEPGQRTREG